jgi:hypothetical protein
MPPWSRQRAFVHEQLGERLADDPKLRLEFLIEETVRDTVLTTQS